MKNENFYKSASYPLMMRFMHILIALIVLYMLSSGFVVSSFKTKLNMQLITLHKQCGILLIPMICIRALIRLWYHDRLPNLYMNMLRMEVVAALFVQLMLYVIPLLMAVSGYIMSYSGERYVSILGFQVPSFVNKSKDVASFFYTIHVNVAIVLLVLVSLHLLATFKHFVMGNSNIVKSIFCGK